MAMARIGAGDRWVPGLRAGPGVSDALRRRPLASSHATNGSVHQPVMPAEVVEYLAVSAGKVYLDGTLGEGGHAERILQESTPDGVLLGIDRDPRTLEAARRRLDSYGQRATVAQGSYADMIRIARDNNIAGVDGVLLDLGFSSRQIEGAGYGLSFQTDEMLDMRYDPSGETAADMVNQTSETVLADLIFRFGEERRSRAIARHIVRNRPIRTTGELARVVSQALGGRRGRTHPATRTFQALRIAVNQELEHLDAGLAAVGDLLNPGGRLVVISYHSLEDRIVKSWVERQTAVCVCPPELPVCACERRPKFQAVRRRVVRPTESERNRNPRSRSAVMRIVERNLDHNP